MSGALEAKRVLVLGAGRTGVAVARFLCARQVRVVLADREPAKILKSDLPSAVTVCTEESGAQQVAEVDLVVTSPGVPPTNLVLQRARELHVPIWSEIELAARHLKVPIVAVTGTNGKSTTTVLIGEICRQAGKNAFVGGNLGTPLIEAAGGDHWALAVAEVSSFQLEWVESFRPHVGVFLNLTPDHLDRYPDLHAYGKTKLRLFACQTPTDFAIINRDDQWIWSQRSCLRSTVRFFAQGPSLPRHAWVEGDKVYVSDESGDAWRLELSASPLVGAHNRDNIMAAALAARCLGLPEGAVQAALQSVRPLPHRLELVREWRGVRFYDDSKGTNVGAVKMSLLSFDRPLVLLAGGYDKGGSYECLGEDLRNRVRHAVFFGSAGPKWAAEVGRFVPHTVVPKLREAVRVAAELARPGDVVLLSPGCASFDEFQDYAHRGRCFRQWVEEL
ncbi:UDP-N-acetylmuramoylalanine--D-glutamate ligase [bacterium HR30]|nr:UDP-N-acetylmuramoylalanine--D-glutamate ligase [bacterium HR30]